MFNEAHVAITKVLADELGDAKIVECATNAIPGRYASGLCQRAQHEVVSWMKRYSKEHPGDIIVVPAAIADPIPPWKLFKAALEVGKWTSRFVIIEDARPVTLPDSPIEITSMYPGFSPAYRGGETPWRVLRFDSCTSGRMALREVGDPLANWARAEVASTILSNRKTELWRQVQELQGQVTPDDSQEKAIRLAERLGDLMHRVRVLGTDKDTWGQS